MSQNMAFNISILAHFVMCEKRMVRQLIPQNVLVSLPMYGVVMRAYMLSFCLKDNFCKGRMAVRP